MLQLNNIDNILNFAIDAEQEAFDFYMNLANKLSNNQMKAVFEGFAKEEIAHKAKLMKIKEEGAFDDFKREKIDDLKMEEYVVAVKPNPNMTYKEALVLAMKKEKSAFRLYSNLASIANNDILKNVLLMLAQEEAKHKLRFELEYDEFVLREN